MKQASKTTMKHKALAKKKVRIAVATVSDSKFAFHWKGAKGEETEDVSGKKMCNMIKKSGHELCFYAIVPDTKEMIQGIIKYAAEIQNADAVITTGGTGLTKRDVTIEALDELCEKRLPGFGELFRKISTEEIGNAAILTRAEAGVYRGTVIFALPGSPNACEVGTKIILEEVEHIAKHARE